MDVFDKSWGDDIVSFRKKSGTLKLLFKNLKPHILLAIKESSYKFDARLNNIANEVSNILTFCMEPGVENTEGLWKIIDKTVNQSVALGCDLSVIVKGILLGSFRSCPFVAQESPKVVNVLIREILLSVSKYKGDAKEAVQGIVAAIFVIANEFNLDLTEALAAAKEDIIYSSKAISPEFADAIKEVLPNLDNPS